MIHPLAASVELRVEGERTLEQSPYVTIMLLDHPHSLTLWPKLHPSTNKTFKLYLGCFDENC